MKQLKILLPLLLLALVLVSCGSRKKSSYKRPSSKRTTVVTSSTTVVNEAQKYLGTPYKYGGGTKRGMDCSGLINTAFANAGQRVPRTTGTLYKATGEIDLDEVAEGDLLFFSTGKSSKRLNHVGIVTRVTPAEILFIHSTTSRGVIISSLNEPYWLQAYLSAGRLR